MPVAEKTDSPQRAREPRKLPAGKIPQEMPKARPFLKWVGGKSQLLPELRAYYPFAHAAITRYVEPFAGGGAVLFDILNQYEPEQVFIFDRNADLINAYCCLRDQAEALIARLTALQEHYLPLTADERKACYLARRASFNALKQAGDIAALSREEQLERAALLIFLNKTCFNGLYRVNKKGLFNVPAGVSKAPAICNADNLRLVSAKLAKVSIVCADYTACADVVDEHTFVYFDPPYRPISASSDFTAYTEECFTDVQQAALAAFFARLHAKGARLVLSNSDPGNAGEDDFFDRLYTGFTIRRVQARRMINCKAQGRGEIRELVISNFAPYS